MQFTHISTESDIMKESLIYGANLDGKYGFPMLNPFNTTPDKTVNFHRSKKLIADKGGHFNRLCFCFLSV